MITKDEFTDIIKENGFECCYKDMSKTYELGAGDIESVYNTLVKKLNLARVVVNEVKLCEVCDCDRTETITVYKECYLKDAEH